MAGSKRAIKISVLANTRQFKKELSNLGDVSGFNKLRSGLGKVGAALKQVTMLGAAATAAIATAGIKAASDLEQSTGTIDDVFKEHAGVVHEFARNAAKDVGLSANAYNEMAALISTQLKNGGTAMDELAGKSNKLISLGADLSAGFGGSTADAVAAISSALKGERDPIEKYGVSLKQATIDAKAAEMGFKKVGGSLSGEANQAATLALIMEQTSDFHGKFARENDTLAHKIQVLQAQFTDIAAKIGALLIPALTAAAGWVSENLEPAFQKLTAWAQENLAPAIEQLKAKFTEWLPTLKEIGATLAGQLGSAVQSLGNYLTSTVIPAAIALVQWGTQHSSLLVAIAAAVGGIVAAYRIYQTVMAAVRVVTVGFTLAQSALNFVLTANPIGLIILAIAGLIAAFVAVWNYSEGFRAFWQGLWQGIQGIVSGIVNWFTSTVPNAFWGAIAAVQGFFSSLGATISGIASGISSAISGAVQSVISWFSSLPGRVRSAVSSMASGVSSGIGEVVSFFSSMPGRILGALGNLGGLLLDAGKSVIRGFVNGLKSAFGWVKDSLSSLTSWLPDWKGPKKRDAVILRKSGQLVIGGFVNGLESQYGKVKKSLGGLTGELAGYVGGDLSATLAPGTLAAPGGLAPVVYHIEVKTLEPTIEVGRKVAAAIDEYKRYNGR